VAFKEVWGVKEVDVKDVAFDPFSAINQASKCSEFVRKCDAKSLFDGLCGCDLVSDWADAADA
jgi:hypothetical protein